VTRREAAGIVGALFIDRGFADRGAVGHAWTVGCNRPGYKCRVGLRIPDPYLAGRFYAEEYGAGWNYDEAIAAARFRKARGRDWTSDERDAWSRRQTKPSSDFLS
jgi:hypothetical protein